jgi:hypothetical protein
VSFFSSGFSPVYPPTINKILTINKYQLYFDSFMSMMPVGVLTAIVIVPKASTGMIVFPEYRKSSSLVEDLQTFHACCKYDRLLPSPTRNCLGDGSPT